MEPGRNNPYHATSTDKRLEQVDVSNVLGIVRVNQVIVLAMGAGILAFLCVTIFLFFSGGKVPNFGMKPLVIAAWAMAASAIPFSFVVPGLVTKPLIAQILSSEAAPVIQDKISNVYSSQLVIGCSLLEAPGLFNTVVFLLNDHPGSAVAAFVMAAFVLLRFPTVAKYQDWMTNQLSAQ